MTTAESIITIGVVVLGTMLTRFLPFILFPANKKPPKYIEYLGTVLPFAVMGMLIVFGLKHVSIWKASHGFPEFIAVVLVVILHLWKRNTLLSIAVGTISYMLLLQYVFVS